MQSFLALLKGRSKNKLTCAGNSDHKDKSTCVHSLVYLLCSIKICTHVPMCTYTHTLIHLHEHTIQWIKNIRLQFQVGWSQRLIINTKQPCQFQNPDHSAFSVITVKPETAFINIFKHKFLCCVPYKSFQVQGNSEYSTMPKDLGGGIGYF